MPCTKVPFWYMFLSHSHLSRKDVPHVESAGLFAGHRSAAAGAADLPGILGARKKRSGSTPEPFGVRFWASAIGMSSYVQTKNISKRRASGKTVLPSPLWVLVRQCPWGRLRRQCSSSIRSGMEFGHPLQFPVEPFLIGQLELLGSTGKGQASFCSPKC